MGPRFSQLCSVMQVSVGVLVCSLRGERRLACASMPLPIQTHSPPFPCPISVQQVIENHILKLFQSNLVPADPE